jgi:hypothetical protein
MLGVLGETGRAQTESVHPSATRLRAESCCQFLRVSCAGLSLVDRDQTEELRVKYGFLGVMEARLVLIVSYVIPGGERTGASTLSSSVMTKCDG